MNWLTPIWLFKTAVLSASLFPPAHPQCQTFRCQIPSIPLLSGGRKKALVENFQEVRLHFAQLREERKRSRSWEHRVVWPLKSKWVWNSRPVAAPSCHWDNNIEAGIINFMVCLMEKWQVALLLCQVNRSDVAESKQTAGEPSPFYMSYYILRKRDSSSST